MFERARNLLSRRTARAVLPFAFAGGVIGVAAYCGGSSIPDQPGYWDLTKFRKFDELSARCVGPHTNLVIAPLNFPHIDLTIRLENPGVQELLLRFLARNTNIVISQDILRASASPYRNTIHAAVTGEDGTLAFRGVDRLRVLAHRIPPEGRDLSQKTVIAAGEIPLPPNCP